MARDDILDRFRIWAQGRDDLEPGAASTLIDLKADYLGDPEPGRWRPGDLSEVLLEWIPRKVTADDEWFASVIPTARALLTFLHGNGLLHKGSATLDALLHELDVAAKEFDEAVHDTSRFGQAKSLFSGVSQSELQKLASDPAAMQAFIDRHNALGYEERVARTGGPTATFPRPFHDVPDASSPLGGADDEDGIVAVLPAVRLAAPADLAAAARDCRTVRDLATLVAWLGRSRAVTATGVLTLKEARSACSALGLPFAPGWPSEDTDPDVYGSGHEVRTARDVAPLDRLWTLAIEMSLVTVNSARAVPGPDADALAADAPDADVLDLWGDLFHTVVDLGETGGDDRFEALPVDGLAEYGVVRGLVSAYEGAPHTLDDVVEEIEERLATLADPWPTVGGRVVRARMTRYLDWLAELGVVPARSATEGVELTALGVFGMREWAVAQGFVAPVIGSVDGLDADGLVDTLESVTGPLFEVLVVEWAAGRHRQAALDELLAVGRAGGASRRRLALVAVDSLVGDEFEAVAESLADDPVLGPAAFMIFAAREDFAGGLETLTPAQQDGVFLETFAFYVAEASGATIREHDLPPQLWALVDDVAVPRLAAATHPDVLLVLDALGTGHPRGRVRKAAKKAAHKHRLAGRG